MKAQFPAELQSLLTVAIYLDGAEALKLFEYLPDEKKNLLSARAQKFLKLPESDRRTAVGANLKALRSEFLLRQITDVHPSHIALVLANESAPIIRIIFHHLPVELANEIMKYFPESATRKLAACPDPPAIAEELLEVVKHAFVRQFTFFLPNDYPLTRLNNVRLRTLVREMSFQIIAVAMRRIDRQELVDSLQRFPRGFSKEIVRRLKLLRDVEIEQVRMAEKCLVWLTSQQLRNFAITEDAGLMMFAGSLLNESENLQKFLMQKFSIEEAGRIIDLIERLRQAEPEMAAYAREQTLTTVAAILQPRQPLIPTERNMQPAENNR